MNIYNRFLNYFSIFIIIAVAFLGGFFISKRESFIGKNEPIINFKTKDGYGANYLNNIETREIIGLYGGQKQIYGTLFFVINEGRTDLLFKFSNIPSQIKNSAGKDTPTPDKYQMFYAKGCCNGLNYEYLDLNTFVNLETVKNNTKKANFATVVNFNILNSGGERIIINNLENKNNFKIKKDGEKDWPKITMEENAPYLWVNL